MKRIEYLFGNESVKIYPHIPYASESCFFLDELSKKLREDQEARSYSDIQTFAFWIRNANIQSKKRMYLTSGVSIGKGLCFHIAPSNVPINFAFSLVFGLLAGNSNIVRVSSKNFEQTRIICRIMKDMAADEQFRWVAEENAIIMYEHDDDITERFSSCCNTRIIWGGDETIRSIRKSPLPPKSTEIVFADRYSFAIIDATILCNIDIEKIRKLAMDFYNDSYLMDQNACSTPHLVCFEGNEKDVSIAKERFWSEVNLVAKEQYELTDMKATEKYTLLCEAIISNDINNVIKYDNMLYVVNLKSLPSDYRVMKGKFGLFYDMHLKTRSQLIPLMGERLQTCAVYGINPKDLADWAVENHLLGIDRVVPIGHTLDIDVIWDGYDIISALSRRISF